MMTLIFIWGFSEASWFFVIPDVILSLYALTVPRLKKVIWANIICLAGAMIGGILVFTISTNQHALIQEWMLKIPAIHGYMIEHVQQTMDEEGPFGIIFGPLFGVPYKLYALEAHNYTNAFIFILITIPARLLRFILVSVVAFILSHQLFGNMGLKFKIIIWCMVWIIVYTIYFTIHPF